MGMDGEKNRQSYQPVSPLASEDESDADPVENYGRSSTEINKRDREVLAEEEEHENLLRKQQELRQHARPYGCNHEHKSIWKLWGKKRRYNGVPCDTSYEMMEDGPRSETNSLASMSSTELDKRNLSKAQSSRKRRYSICAIVTASIVVLFFAFAYGAYRASQRSRMPPNTQLMSNGSSLFAPTTLIISLDGFRADFLTRGISPTLNQFIAEGVSPEYMLPSFPSVTFPNHYSIVTGLYPESHGIVGNTFYAPQLDEEFSYGNPAHSMQPKWWAGGEPIWVTAEKAHVKTGIHMWPGSEAGMDFSATYIDKFNGSEILPKKTQRIFELLDLPSITSSISKARPQLIAAYVPVVDSNGHKYGPNSTEVYDTIKEVDDMLHDIFMGLEERNLTNIVNVMVVSDHGMATTSNDRLIQLDDIIDVSLIEHIDGWPLYGLRPKHLDHLGDLYDKLKAEADVNPNFDVYLRDKDMPERFHFHNNDRIAPLWIVPKVGWAIVKKEDFDVQKAKETGETYGPKGLHGYDHEEPLMRAIFVARGPSFPHPPGSRIEPFQNIEIYNILCDTLGIEPRPNNGTLRLPLIPNGIHGDGGKAGGEGPKAASPLDDHTDSALAPETASENDEEMLENASKEKPGSTAAATSFWRYLQEKIRAAMDRVHGVIHKLKNPKNKNEEGSDP